MRKRFAISLLFLAAGGAIWVASLRVHVAPPVSRTLGPKVSGERTARSMRPVHPFSVVPGGVFGRDEVRDWMRLDPVVASHYEGLAVGELRPVRVPTGRQVHVSYRRGDMVFWTPYKVTLKAGETVLTDGVNEVRARCGNRISATVRGPVEGLGVAPKESVLDETLPAGLARGEFHPGHTPEWLIAAVKDPSQQASRDAVAIAGGGGAAAGSDSFGGGATVFVGGGGGFVSLPRSGGGGGGGESTSGTPPAGPGETGEPGSGSPGSTGATGATGSTASTGQQLAGSIPQPGLTPNPWLPPLRDSITEGGGGSAGTPGASGGGGSTGSTGSTGPGGSGSSGGTGSTGGGTGYTGGSGFTGFTGFTGSTGGSGGGGGGGFTGPTSSVQAVPEPATFFLVGSLLVSIGLARKLLRRR